ncbi:MAG: ribulose-phosphate 3-epimerase [Candidatus Aminicenantes bacterium]|nr:ribulose-phosphate 3-epimerase [Candidatus Aminicenantes bacterium]
MALLAPSLLSADFTRLAEAAAAAEAGGADLLHVDIMDGHFVPGLTFGPGLVARLKKATRLPLDVHLMVDTPREVVPWFLDAGADWISIHVEATPHLHRDIDAILTAGRKAGAALNPATPLAALQDILPDLDFVLIMCVNPGRGSQRFIPGSRQRIRDLRRTLREASLPALVEIDGGVNDDNVAGLVRDGAQIIVAGNAVFNDPDPARAAARLKNLAARAESA